MNEYNKFSCVILPGNPSNCKQQYLNLYHQAYFFWKNIAYQALISEKNFSSAKNLSSDEFIMQREHACILYNNQIIAMYGFDWKIINPTTLELSFFKQFPEEIINNIIKKHTNIMSVFFMVIDPLWRKSQCDYRISEILTRFSTVRQQETNTNIMIFTARNNKKTNELGIRHGGSLLLKNYNNYNTESDIIAIYKNNIKPCLDYNLELITQSLWKNKKIALLNYYKENILHENAC